MEAIADRIRTIAFFVIFSSAMEALLPDGRIKKYALWITGIVISLVIVESILVIPDAMQDNISRSTAFDNATYINVSTSMEKAVCAYCKAFTGYDDAKASVEYDNGRIKHITVSTDNCSPSTALMRATNKELLITALSRLFGLENGDITVN